MELPPLDALLPHRPPARLIERVVAADELGATAELSVREGPWLRCGVLAPEALIEALAQTAAVYASVRARALASTSSPPAGHLAGIANFAFEAPARPGDLVVLAVKLERTFGQLVAFGARAYTRGRDVARGELRVALTAP